MLTPLREKIALSAAVEPILMSGKRRLTMRDIRTELSGMAQRGLTYGIL